MRAPAPLEDLTNKTKTKTKTRQVIHGDGMVIWCRGCYDYERGGK